MHARLDELAAPTVGYVVITLPVPRHHYCSAAIPQIVGKLLVKGALWSRKSQKFQSKTYAGLENFVATVSIQETLN